MPFLSGRREHSLHGSHMNGPAPNLISERRTSR